MNEYDKHGSLMRSAGVMYDRGIFREPSPNTVAASLLVIWKRREDN